MSIKSIFGFSSRDKPKDTVGNGVSFMFGRTTNGKPVNERTAMQTTEKIDAAVATVMALDRAIRNQGNDGSVYDERGIIVF